MKKNLSNVTLLGIDCLDIERLKLAADICQKDFEFGVVKLLSCIPDNDPRVISIDPLDSIDKYSEFCIKLMNDFVDTEFALLIQHDGFILNPAAWTNEFLEYDYIGAPWWYDDDCNVGNGGFSLRSKKLLEMLQSDSHITEYSPEDHQICRTYGPYLKERGIKFAPESVASKFSIEGAIHPDTKVLVKKYGNVWTKEFGFHGLRKTDISNWVENHPEYSQVKNIFDTKYHGELKEYYKETMDRSLTSENLEKFYSTPVTAQGMFIQPLSSKHVQYVAGIIKDRWEISDEEARDEIERWMSDTDNSMCYVGIVEGEPVAFGLFDVQSKVDPSIHSWNRQLWVEPAHRGSDYGHQLTLERFKWAKDRGYESVYLSTEAAKGYHLKFGWEVVREEFKADKTITIMKYDLKKYKAI